MSVKREYDDDVFYEVWSRGGDPDAIDYDRVADAYYDGLYPEECALAEIRCQNPRPPHCLSCNGSGVVEVAYQEYADCPDCIAQYWRE